VKLEIILGGSVLTNSLTEMLNNHLLDKKKKNDEERAEIEARRRESKEFKFYPSSIGKCPREIVYAMLGYPRPEIPSRVLRIFDNGDSMHERYQNWFAEMGILISPELPIKDDELGISGRTDALIRLNDELILVELKSSNANQFERMQKAGAPREEFSQQLQLYLHLTGIKKGIILIENKNDQSILEFEEEYDNTMANELVRKIRSCIHHAKEGTLPDRPFNKSSFECRYCDFNTECWST
jgi:hypothetical protein